jgi:hypothetical protein
MENKEKVADGNVNSGVIESAGGGSKGGAKGGANNGANSIVNSGSSGGVKGGAKGGANNGRNNRKRGGKGRNAVLVVIAILIMAGVGIWYYTYLEGQKYFITDNAKVMANFFAVIHILSNKHDRSLTCCQCYSIESTTIQKRLTPKLCKSMAKKKKLAS